MSPLRRVFYSTVPVISWWALVWLWLIYAMNSNTRQIFYYVLPPIVGEFKISPFMSGVIAAIVTVAVSLLAIPSGPWFDRGGQGWSRKYRSAIVATGYFVFSLLTGVYFLTTYIWNVVILQGIKNAFGGAGEVVEVTTLAEWFPEEQRGLALGIQHSAYPWGTLLGALATSGILATLTDWRYVFLIVPLAMIPIWVGYWIFATRNRYAKFNDQAMERGLTPPLSEERPTAAPGALRRSLRNPNIIVPAVTSAFGIATYTGISYLLPLYLSNVGGYSYAAAAGYSVIFTITGGVGQIAWGIASDYVGRKISLIVTFLWIGLGIALFQFSLVSLALLVALQIFAGFATNAIFPVLYAFASDAAERGGIGTANAIMLFFFYLGGVSPLVLGFLIGLGGGFQDAAGYTYGFYFLTLIAVISAVLITLFTRETAGVFRGRDRALVSREACNM